jgi:hypothetical protein
LLCRCTIGHVDCKRAGFEPNFTFEAFDHPFGNDASGESTAMAYQPPGHDAVPALMQSGSDASALRHSALTCSTISHSPSVAAAQPALRIAAMQDAPAAIEMHDDSDMDVDMEFGSGFFDYIATL